MAVAEELVRLRSRVASLESVQRISDENLEQAIGEAVMQRLRTVDQVAYVRYASVYKEFRDVSEFMSEISSLGKTKK